MNFVAIDFETATGSRSSACAVAIVTAEDGNIVDQYYQLIQPPGNFYWWKNIEVHGITPEHTWNAPLFADIFHDVAKRLQFNTIVAHNEAFDRTVLANTMDYYGLDDSRISLDKPWECTMKIYRHKGFRPCNLKACCDAMGIELQHHNALSDALACAKLYLLHLKSSALKF